VFCSCFALVSIAGIESLPHKDWRESLSVFPLIGMAPVANRGSVASKQIQQEYSFQNVSHNQGAVLSVAGQTEP